MKFTEADMQRISAPLSATAEEKCKEALNNVSAALRNVGYSHTTGGEIRRLYENAQSFSMEMKRGYSGRTVRIFTQGSYANDTNISKTSDIDVAVVLESSFSMKDPEIFILNESHEQIRERYGFTATDDTAIKLKNDVEDALQRYFGTNTVQRNNKSIKVKGNSTRTDCDTVPAIRNRDYSKDIYTNENNYVGGIQIHADDGEVIVNYPEQHIQNGISKNKETNYNFKKCVRAMKNIRELMKENGYSISSDISSFGLESLIWNVPDKHFNEYPTVLWYVFLKVAQYLSENTNNFTNYYEANGIKKLFNNETVKSGYIKFIKDLSTFYEYEA